MKFENINEILEKKKGCITDFEIPFDETENKNINTYGNKTTYNYILKFILNFPNEEQAA